MDVLNLDTSKIHYTEKGGFYYDLNYIETGEYGRRARLYGHSEEEVKNNVNLVFSRIHQRLEERVPKTSMLYDFIDFYLFSLRSYYPATYLEYLKNITNLIENVDVNSFNSLRFEKMLESVEPFYYRRILASVIKGTAELAEEVGVSFSADVTLTGRTSDLSDYLLSPAQLDELLTFCLDDNATVFFTSQNKRTVYSARKQKTKPALAFAIVSGLKISTIATILTKNVDLVNKTITFPQYVYQMEDKTAELIKSLEYKGYISFDNENLFPITVNTFPIGLKRVLEQAGLPTSVNLNSLYRAGLIKRRQEGMSYDALRRMFNYKNSYDVKRLVEHSRCQSGKKPLI